MYKINSTNLGLIAATATVLRNHTVLSNNNQMNKVLLVWIKRCARKRIFHVDTIKECRFPLHEIFTFKCFFFFICFFDVDKAILSRAGLSSLHAFLFFSFVLVHRRFSSLFFFSFCITDMVMHSTHIRSVHSTLNGR